MYCYFRNIFLYEQQMSYTRAVVADNLPPVHFYIVFLGSPLLVKSWCSLWQVGGPNSYPHWLPTCQYISISMYCSSERTVSVD